MANLLFLAAAAAASSASVSAFLSAGRPLPSARENQVGWVREGSELSARVCACIAVSPGEVALGHTPTAAAAEATVCAAINPLLSCPTSSPASLVHCGWGGEQKDMTTEGIEAASYKAAFDI